MFNASAVELTAACVSASAEVILIREILSECLLHLDAEQKGMKLLEWNPRLFSRCSVDASPVETD